MSYGQIPAGWYADPQLPGTVRFWDGTGWTQHTRPVAPPAARPEAETAAPGASSPPTVSPDGAYLLSSVTERGGASAESPTQPPGATHRTGRKGRLMAGVAGVVAIAIAVTGVVVWAPWDGKPGLSSAKDRLTATGTTFAVKSDVEYAKPMLNLKQDHEFKFPGSYDPIDLCGDFKGAVSRTGCAFRVFTDPSLTHEVSTLAQSQSVGLTGKKEITVVPIGGAVPVCAAWNSANSKLRGGKGFTLGDKRDCIRFAPSGALTWGQSDQYFLAQYLDKKGKKRAKPLVTRFTIKRELATPRVTFGHDKNGNVAASWAPVAGATGYLIISAKRDADDQTKPWYEELVGESEKPAWKNVPRFYDKDENAALDNGVFASEQNGALALFSGSSADDRRLGVSTETIGKSVAIGVIAFNSKRQFSAYRECDAKSVLGPLPYESATKQEGEDYIFEDPKKAPMRIYFTSLDGTTRSTRAVYRPDRVGTSTITSRDESGRVSRAEYWSIPAVGEGTQLGHRVRVLKKAVPDVAAVVKQWNAASLAAAPPTGAGTFTVESQTAVKAGKAVKVPPKTQYPIYGSSEMVRFIAQHLVGQTQAIDVSDYVNQPGAPDLQDAAEEARWQNPYAANVSGVQIGRDGKTVYVSYEQSAQYKKIQAQTKSKVDEIISSNITKGMSGVEKVRVLNSWLVKNAEYDMEAYRQHQKYRLIIPFGFEYAWRADGVLLKGKGVCASYAAAYQLLANAAGVQTVLVTGDVTNGGPHAWNKSNVNGKWRAIDTTWNDSPRDPNRYLLITDAQFTGSALRTESNEWMTDSLIPQFVAK